MYISLLTENVALKRLNKTNVYIEMSYNLKDNVTDLKKLNLTVSTVLLYCNLYRSKAINRRVKEN